MMYVDSCYQKFHYFNCIYSPNIFVAFNIFIFTRLAFLVVTGLEPVALWTRIRHIISSCRQCESRVCPRRRLVGIMPF